MSFRSLVGWVYFERVNSHLPTKKTRGSEPSRPGEAVGSLGRSRENVKGDTRESVGLLRNLESRSLRGLGRPLEALGDAQIPRN